MCSPLIDSHAALIIPLLTKQLKTARANHSDQQLGVWLETNEKPRLKMRRKKKKKTFHLLCHSVAFHNKEKIL